MKKIFALLFMLFLLIGVTSTANALIIFSDNFDGENSGAGALDYNGFSNWNVSDGTVDLIGNGYFDYFPANGLYVDMDGSTSNAGTLTSNDIEVTTLGTYYLSFDLAGNQRNTNMEFTTILVDVNVGSFSTTISLDQFAPFTTYTQSFEIFDLDLQSPIQISFAAYGGDNVGMLLDNVSLSDTAPVPEPATMLLLGTGLVGLAATSRKKIFKKK